MLLIDINYRYRKSIYLSKQGIQSLEVSEGPEVRQATNKITEAVLGK